MRSAGVDIRLLFARHMKVAIVKFVDIDSKAFKVYTDCTLVNQSDYLTYTNVLFYWSIQVQVAALQTVRTVAQAGASEQPRGEAHEWALLLLHKLAADITSIIYMASKVHHLQQFRVTFFH